MTMIALLAAAMMIALMLRAQMAHMLVTLTADQARATEVDRSVDGRMNAMLNQEAGLRGYLATADAAFLEPYHSGRIDEANLRAQRSVGELPAEDRDELGQALALEQRAARRWHDQIAEPQIAARATSANLELEPLLLAGKEAFDSYRAAYGTLRHALDRARLNGERRRRAELRRADAIAAALLLLLALFGLAVARLVARRTVAPLVALCDAAERGEITAEAVRSSSLREVLVLGETLERLFSAFQDRAMRDSLTRAYNRGFLADWLPRQVRLSRRSGAPLSALMVDVDHFKRINDTHGHGAGDQVLVALARCIEQQLRSTDVVVRYGGEEFTVLLPDTPVAGGFVTAERLRAAIAAMTEREGLPAGVRVTASIGLAAIGRGDDGALLLPRADAALYQAKRGGRNRVVAAAPAARVVASAPAAVAQAAVAQAAVAQAAVAQAAAAPLIDRGASAAVAQLA